MQKMVKLYCFSFAMFFAMPVLCKTVLDEIVEQEKKDLNSGATDISSQESKLTFLKGKLAVQVKTFLDTSFPLSADEMPAMPDAQTFPCVSAKDAARLLDYFKFLRDKSAEPYVVNAFQQTPPKLTGKLETDLPDGRKQVDYDEAINITAYINRIAKNIVGFALEDGSCKCSANIVLMQNMRNHALYWQKMFDLMGIELGKLYETEAQKQGLRSAVNKFFSSERYNRLPIAINVNDAVKGLNKLRSFSETFSGKMETDWKGNVTDINKRAKDSTVTQYNNIVEVLNSRIKNLMTGKTLDDLLLKPLEAGETKEIEANRIKIQEELWPMLIALRYEDLTVGLNDAKEVRGRVISSKIMDSQLKWWMDRWGPLGATQDEQSKFARQVQLRIKNRRETFYKCLIYFAHANSASFHEILNFAGFDRGVAESLQKNLTSSSEAITATDAFYKLLEIQKSDEDLEKKLNSLFTLLDNYFYPDDAPYKWPVGQEYYKTMKEYAELVQSERAKEIRDRDAQFAGIKNLTPVTIHGRGIWQEDGSSGPGSGGSARGDETNVNLGNEAGTNWRGPNWAKQREAEFEERQTRDAANIAEKAAAAAAKEREGIVKRNAVAGMSSAAR